MFNINWSLFITWLLPNDLRKVRIVRYLIALVNTVKELHYDFLQFYDDTLYEIKINGQTIKLERVLNDKFDPIQRRIYISDGDYYHPPIFYEEYKNLPVIFFNENNEDNPIFYSINSIDNLVSFNFFVNIPADVWHDRTRVRALVNKYKIFGRTFDILLID